MSPELANLFKRDGRWAEAQVGCRLDSYDASPALVWMAVIRRLQRNRAGTGSRSNPLLRPYLTIVSCQRKRNER
jgi:hypothetical protein